MYVRHLVSSALNIPKAVPVSTRDFFRDTTLPPPYRTWPRGCWSSICSCVDSHCTGCRPRGCTPSPCRSVDRRLCHRPSPRCRTCWREELAERGGCCRFHTFCLCAVWQGRAGAWLLTVQTAREGCQWALSLQSACRAPPPVPWPYRKRLLSWFWYAWQTSQPVMAYLFSPHSWPC